MRIVRAGVMLAMFIGAMGGSADAAPFLTGSFSKASGSVGTFRGVNSAGAVVNLNLATALDFIVNPFAGTTPGVAGKFEVTERAGDFLTLLAAGEVGTMADFTFAGIGNANYPNVPVSPLETTVGGVTFDLLTVSVVLQNSSVIVLKGTGLFKAAGYADTLGIFNFTGNKAGTSFSFAASQAVPEPASLMLFGLGLVGIGARLRRKTSAA